MKYLPILSGAQMAEELVPQIQVWKKREIKSTEDFIITTLCNRNIYMYVCIYIYILPYGWVLNIGILAS